MGTSYRGIEDSRFAGLLLPARSYLFRHIIYKRDKGICALCGGSVTFAEMHLDHVYPNALGGSDNADNMQVTHGTCNIRKNAVPPNQFTYDAFSDPSVALDQTMTIVEAAKYLDLGYVTVRAAVRRGRIRILTHIDGKAMVSRTDVQAYQPNRRVQLQQRAINEAKKAEEEKRWKRNRSRYARG